MQTQSPVFEAELALADAVVEASIAGQVEFTAADHLLQAGEMILESWVRSRGHSPTEEEVEGFRLLALHKQGSRGEPSFNACRETARELVYQRNMALHLAETDPNLAIHHLGLQAMVLRHLALFVGGKLVESGLGDFCCSSKPIRGIKSEEEPIN